MAFRHAPYFWWLALALLCCLIKPTPVPAQSSGPGPDWIASGDPCYTVENQKLLMADPSQLECLPVKVTVTWDVEEEWSRPWGVDDRVSLQLRDRFTAALMIMRHRTDKKRVLHFNLFGPAPCCPGKVDSQVVEADIRLLACIGTGRGRCQTIVFNSLSPRFNEFKPKPEDDNFFSIGWNHGGSGNNVDITSANIQLPPGIIKEPLGQASGLLGTESGGTYHLDVRGPRAITWAEMARAIEAGELTKTFRMRQNPPTAHPGEARTVNAKVTVRLEFAEPKEECWSVQVRGWELDDIGSPLMAKLPGGYQKKFPLHIVFDWLVDARVGVKRFKGSWQFKSGEVIKARVRPRIKFKRHDLFKCSLVQCNGGINANQNLSGSYLGGKRVGGGLSLQWRVLPSVACVSCRGKKTYLHKYQFYESYGSEAFLKGLNEEVLPLKHGYKRKFQDAQLKYTIILKRIGKGPCGWRAGKPPPTDP